MILGIKKVTEFYGKITYRDRNEGKKDRHINGNNIESKE